MISRTLGAHWIMTVAVGLCLPAIANAFTVVKKLYNEPASTSAFLAPYRTTYSQNGFRGLERLARSGDRGALYVVATLELSSDEPIRNGQNAMRRLTQLAIDGLVEAQYLVGSASTDLCRIHGQSSTDCLQAKELLEAAARAGYPPALALRAQQLIESGAMTDFESRSVVLDLLEQAVAGGSPDAMTMLAQSLEQADKQKYSSRIATLLDSAAALGEPLVLAARARALEQSAQSSSDLRRAFDLYAAAYSSGTNSSSAELGMFLIRNPEFRSLVEHSPFTLLANACEREIDDACIQAALARIRGCTNESCKTEAERYFALAAERGEIRAYRAYADILRKGTDVPMDKAAAAEYYEKSAELGDTGAMVNLGVMLARGDGVERNLNEARRWWRRAADAGSIRAENLLEEYTD